MRPLDASGDHPDSKAISGIEDTLVDCHGELAEHALQMHSPEVPAYAPAQINGTTEILEHMYTALQDTTFDTAKMNK